MVTENKVRIQSTSSKNEYVLTLNENGKSIKCSCPDFHYRKRTCKHMYRFNTSCEVVSAFIKPSGTICARVTEEDKQFFVNIYPSGDEHCSFCKAGGCIHTCKVLAQRNEIHPVPEMDHVVCTLSEAMADADTAMRQAEHENPYSVLASTKDVVNNKYAYGCCGHLVKPVDAGCLCGACACK